MARVGGLSLLLGRLSYEGMLGYWNTQDHPFKGGVLVCDYRVQRP